MAIAMHMNEVENRLRERQMLVMAMHASSNHEEEEERLL